MVGATRFELVTFCTPSKRATRLRYAPETKVFHSVEVAVYSIKIRARLQLQFSRRRFPGALAIGMPVICIPHSIHQYGIICGN